MSSKTLPPSQPPSADSQDTWVTNYGSRQLFWVAAGSELTYPVGVTVVNGREGLPRADTPEKVADLQRQGIVGIYQNEPNDPTFKIHYANNDFML